MSKQMLITLVIIGGLLVVGLPVAGVALTGYSKAKEKARRVETARNLKQLGEALLMYSGDNGGFFTVDSDTPFEPLNTQDVLDDGKIYACPSASIEVKPGEPYRYESPAGKGEATETAPDATAAQPDNAWMNALFIDGHTDETAADPVPDKD